jgi:hypothetical protein
MLHAENMLFFVACSNVLATATVFSEWPVLQAQAVTVSEARPAESVRSVFSALFTRRHTVFTPLQASIDDETTCNVLSTNAAEPLRAWPANSANCDSCVAFPESPNDAKHSAACGSCAAVETSSIKFTKSIIWLSLGVSTFPSMQLCLQEVCVLVSFGTVVGVWVG